MRKIFEKIYSREKKKYGPRRRKGRGRWKRPGEEEKWIKYL
jgi:hypothetical protein